MTNTNETAEPPGASAGSQPVAWAALRDDGDIAWIGYTEEAAADGASGRTVVPLYRQPQPTLTDEERLRYAREIESLRDVVRFERETCERTESRLRLTDEEREAIQRAIDSHQQRAAEMHSRSWAASAIKNDCDTLRGLLERLT